MRPLEADKSRMQVTIPIAGSIVPYMRSPAFCEFPDAPGSRSAFEFAHGKPMWELLASDAALKASFDAHMASRRNAAGVRPWYEIYPAAQRLGPGARQDHGAAMIVDVGGGKGHDVAAFRARHPELPGRFILQDLPETLPSSQGTAGVEMMAHDFFTPQPVKGIGVPGVVVQMLAK